MPLEFIIYSSECLLWWLTHPGGFVFEFNVFEEFHFVTLRFVLEIVGFPPLGFLPAATVWNLPKACWRQSAKIYRRQTSGKVQSAARLTESSKYFFFGLWYFQENTGYTKTEPKLLDNIQKTLK